MPVTQGTAYLYGVSNTIANAVVISTDLTDSYLNTGEVVDEQGNQVSRHYDDLATSGTIVLRYKSAYTVPTPGSGTIAWNGSTYEITEVGKAEEAQGFRQLTLSVLKSANITSA